MELKTKEILRLIERASGIPDILQRKDELEDIVNKFAVVEMYVERFSSLEELTEALKEIEDKLYVCKTFLTTNEAMKYLSIGKFTLLEAAKRGELPHYSPPSKCFYFAKDDLDKWMEGYLNKAKEQGEGEGEKQENEPGIGLPPPADRRMKRHEQKNNSKRL